MVTFRNNNNNNRRSNFRRNDRNFKSNGDRQKFPSNFSSNENFKRKAPGRNNHNAPKLIEKYNDLAKRHFQMVIRFCRRIIYSMQIILLEYLMRKRV